MAKVLKQFKQLQNEIDELKKRVTELETNNIKTSNKYISEDMFEDLIKENKDLKLELKNKEKEIKDIGKKLLDFEKINIENTEVVIENNSNSSNENLNLRLVISNLKKTIELKENSLKTLKTRNTTYKKEIENLKIDLEDKTKEIKKLKENTIKSKDKGFKVSKGLKCSNCGNNRIEFWIHKGKNSKKYYRCSNCNNTWSENIKLKTNVKTKKSNNTLRFEDLSIDDSIVISSGPFEGRFGKIVKLVNKHKIIIKLQDSESNTPINVDIEQLKLI